MANAEEFFLDLNEECALSEEEDNTRDIISPVETDTCSNEITRPEIKKFWQRRKDKEDVDEDDKQNVKIWS